MSSAIPHIRPARSSAIDRVLELWGVARSRHARTRDTPEALTTLLERDPGALLVADADGEVVGTPIAAFDGWRGGMHRLAVAPEWWRRGVDVMLISEGDRRLVPPAPDGSRRWSAVTTRLPPRFGRPLATNATHSCAFREEPLTPRTRCAFVGPRAPKHAQRPVGQAVPARSLRARGGYSPNKRAATAGASGACANMGSCDGMT